MRKLLLMLMVLLPVARMSAQDDPQYRMEIGAGVGMVSYEGDFNGNVLKNMQPMFSALWRYNFDPYKDLRLSATYGKLKGSSKMSIPIIPIMRRRSIPSIAISWM